MDADWKYCIILILPLLLTASAIADPPATQPAARPGWKLTWSDEFDGPKVDRTKWGFEKGNDLYVPDAAMAVAGWGNGEREYYTDQPRNVFTKDGLLHIRAIRETGGNIAFTSARLTTRGLFEQTYGRFEFRAKLPVGKGLWPALWLLPADDFYGGWAASGEIDAMEARGQKPDEILGTLHFGSHWPANAQDSTTFPFPPGQTIADFHVYAVEWEPDEIRFYVDDHLFASKRKWWSSSKVDGQGRGVAPKDDSERNPYPAPFDKPFCIIMNLAVGGQFAGDPDEKTAFPAEMLVDYVRVYRKG